MNARNPGALTTTPAFIAGKPKAGHYVDKYPERPDSEKPQRRNSNTDRRRQTNVIPSASNKEGAEWEEFVNIEDYESSAPVFQPRNRWYETEDSPEPAVIPESNPS